MKLFVGYSKSPEQPQSSARPICHSHTMMNTGANQRPYSLLHVGARRTTHYATGDEVAWEMAHLTKTTQAKWSEV